MKIKYVNIVNAKKQSGVALIIGMVMLLVVTLIALAGMNSASMHESMSANAQNTNRTFQAAESAVGALTGILSGGDISSLQEALNLGEGGHSAVTTFTISDPHLDSNYQVTYLGEVIVTSGSSMDANESSTLLKGYRFELQGVASVEDANAQTTIFKGIEYH